MSAAQWRQQAGIGHAPGILRGVHHGHDDAQHALVQELSNQAIVVGGDTSHGRGRAEVDLGNGPPNIPFIPVSVLSIDHHELGAAPAENGAGFRDSKTHRQTESRLSGSHFGQGCVRLHIWTVRLCSNGRNSHGRGEDLQTRLACRVYNSVRRFEIRPEHDDRLGEC